MNSLNEIIDKKIGEVRTESLDLSFGEIVNMHKAKEIIIQPDYQRLFRWTDVQKSRLIESILLELPIPQIFVIEKENAVLELIDGLQRVSSVIQFIDAESLRKEPLKLQGCDLVEELNDKTFEDLPLKLRLLIKRSSVRTVIIKRQSQSFLRYSMFKRLNTGGAILAPQEIRNCSARVMGDEGEKFYQFLQKMAKHPSFLLCTKILPEQDKEKKGDEELVLRFFAAKNDLESFKNKVPDWLDIYMEKVITQDINFFYNQQERDFTAVFDLLGNTLGETAFASYRNNKPVRKLSPAYYEAITIGVFRVLDQMSKVSMDAIKQKIIHTVQSSQFKEYTGSGANKTEMLKGRIEVIENALLELVHE
ncbi:DUF262 domain-containing protein [Spirulina sp. CS-785/01]|uniref:DUF262 domain-containing protein n=1 Tax=Spirulina sp. CS-785/01 TaxID=3021716 RepID=UPI00232E03E5|nr:DUF262 domain-containing protein [Spirulina sp. CS-785/01]MDB9314989.1 DUF262 domain-containing protein [Spirulina sp. CS-785/01]